VTHKRISEFTKKQPGALINLKIEKRALNVMLRGSHISPREFNSLAQQLECIGDLYAVFRALELNAETFPPKKTLIVATRYSEALAYSFYIIISFS